MDEVSKVMVMPRSEVMRQTAFVRGKAEGFVRGRAKGYAEAVEHMKELRTEDRRYTFLCGVSVGSLFGLAVVVAVKLLVFAQTPAEMAVGMYTPIFAQIDPIRLGEISRQMQIATDYGLRLIGESGIADQHTVFQLAGGYSSHSFVIDRDEATQLFRRVRDPTPLEEPWSPRNSSASSGVSRRPIRTAL